MGRISLSYLSPSVAIGSPLAEFRSIQSSNRYLDFIDYYQRDFHLETPSHPPFP